MAGRTIAVATVEVVADVDKFRQGIGGLGGHISSMTSKIGGAIAALGITNLARDATQMGVEYTKQMDNAAAAVAGLVPQQEKAKKLLEDMTNFAIQTPFDLPGVQTVATRLLAVGQGFGVTSDNVLQYVQTLGDAAAINGKGADSMLNVANVMGKISGQGRIMTRDMNQLTANFPSLHPWEVLSEMTGKSQAELRKLAASPGGLSGVVEPTQLIQALVTEMNNMPGAAGAMERKMQTLGGTMEMFKDTMGVALAQGMKPMTQAFQQLLANPALQQGLVQLATLFGDLLSSIMSELGPELPGLIDSFGQILVAFKPAIPMIGTLAKAFASMMVVLTPLITLLAKFAGVVSGWLEKLDPKWLGLITAALVTMWAVGFGPVGMIAAGITLLGVLIADNWDAIVNATKWFVDAMVGVWNWLWDNLIGPTIDFIKQLIDPFIELYDILVGNSIIPDLVNAIVGWFQKLWDIVVAIFNGIKDAIVAVWDAIWAVIETVLKVIAAGVELYFNTYKAIIMAVWDAIKWVIDTAINGIKAIIDGVWTAIQTATQIAWDTIKSYIVDPITEAKDWVSDRIDDIVGFATDLPGRLVGLFTGMWDGIKTAFKAAINWVIDGWNKLEFKVPGIDTPFGSFGGFTIGLPDIPRLATGAVLGAPTMFIGGEYSGARSNPEIVAPQSMMYDTMLRAMRDANQSNRAGNWQSGPLITMPGAVIQDATDADLVAQRTLVALQAQMVVF